MGVLIVIGMAVIGVTIANRLQGMAGGPWDPVTLETAPGERVVEMTTVGDRLALRLESDSGSRILLVDPASGQVFGEIRAPGP